MHWCDVGRGRLAAMVVGDPQAPPLLLIAGGGGAMWSWARLVPEVWPTQIASATTMQPVESLASSYRVAVFDQAGVGHSADVAPASTADDAASDALRVGRQLLGDEFAVAGMSLGGATAARLALAAPDVVRQLMLVCTFASASTFQSNTPSTAPHDDDDDDSDEITTGVRRSLQPWFIDAHPDITTSVIAPSHATPMHPSVGESSIALFLSHNGHDLADISAPTTVVCGEHDSVFPIANSELIARTITSSELARVPGCGHALHLEAPVELRRAVDHLLSK